MGKLADNEFSKLKANFYNNVAVGSLLAGVVIPIIGFYQAHWTIRDFIAESGFLQLWHFLLPPVLGITATVIAAARAEWFIRRITD